MHSNKLALFNKVKAWFVSSIWYSVSMKQTKILALLVPVLLLITLVFNGMAASGALNGIPTGQISDKYPVLFTPAGYVFSIWSLIYLMLIVFAVYQLLPKQFNDASLNPLRSWFLVTSVLNSLWLWVWQYEYLVLSLLIMILLLLSLIKIYLLKRKGWQTRVPFSLYLGWISVATIANVSVVLYSLNWNGFGVSDLAWTLILMLTAVVLGVTMLYKYHDFLFAGVIVWALIGIAVKNTGIQAIQYNALLGVGVIVGYSIMRWGWIRDKGK